MNEDVTAHSTAVSPALRAQDYSEGFRNGIKWSSHFLLGIAVLSTPSMAANLRAVAERLENVSFDPVIPEEFNDPRGLSASEGSTKPEAVESDSPTRE